MLAIRRQKIDNRCPPCAHIRVLGASAFPEDGDASGTRCAGTSNDAGAPGAELRRSGAGKSESSHGESRPGLLGKARTSGLAREGAVFFGAPSARGVAAPLVSPFRPRDSRLRLMRCAVGRPQGATFEHLRPRGETGLNPSRCLVKRDSCGRVAYRAPDLRLVRSVHGVTWYSARCVVSHGEPWSASSACPRPQVLERFPSTNGRILLVPSSARPTKGCGPSRALAEGAQRPHPRTADRTLHAPKARVSGPEQRDRGGRNPAAPEAPQSILRSERIGVVPGVRCRPASLMFVTATSRREKAGIRDNQ